MLLASRTVVAISEEGKSWRASSWKLVQNLLLMARFVKVRNCCGGSPVGSNGNPRHGEVLQENPTAERPLQNHLILISSYFHSRSVTAKCFLFTCGGLQQHCLTAGTYSLPMFAGDDQQLEAYKGRKTVDHSYGCSLLVLLQNGTAKAGHT